MEGVVLVEAQSGVLVFSRSFTDAFDLRHPRSERMNLGALLFALLRFADNSMFASSEQARGQQHAAQPETLEPGICTFGTSEERIVFAQTPSRKLIVALFTAATLDADVARSLVHRLAYNYEHGNSLENHIAVVLNQGPRLFRDALSRAIEEQVDELLESFAAQLVTTSSTGDHNNHDTKPAFVLFYFSDYLLYKKMWERTDICSEDGSVSGHSPFATATPTGPLGSLGFRSPLALGSLVSGRHAGGTVGNRPTPPSPTQPGRARSVLNLSLRSVYASTRSLFPGPVSRVDDTDAEQPQRGTANRKKKAKKNAVLDHAEPQMFQRVVHFSAQPKAAAAAAAAASSVESPSGSDSGNSSSTDAIACVIVPFVKEVVPLFFAGRARRKRHGSAQQQQHAGQAELKQIYWANFPLANQVLAPPAHGKSDADATSKPAATMKTQGIATDLVAWKQGSCLIIYPDTALSHRASGSASASASAESERLTASESTRLRRQRERKSAVVTLFDALEPLVQALMIGRT